MEMADEYAAQLACRQPDDLGFSGRAAPRIKNNERLIIDDPHTGLSDVGFGSRATGADHHDMYFPVAEPVVSVDAEIPFRYSPDNRVYYAIFSRP